MPWSPLRLVLVLVACAAVGVGLVAVREWAAEGDRFVAQPDPPATAARLDALRDAGFRVWWLGPRWRGERASGATLARDGTMAVVRYGEPRCDADACRYPASVVSRPRERPLVLGASARALRRLR